MTVNLLKELEWQTLYYAKARAWLPLSSVPDMVESLQVLNNILGKSEKEIFIYVVEETVKAKVAVEGSPKFYSQFCVELATYMLEKQTDFEIALKRTHALKAYRQLVYRKSVLKEVILTAIKDYKLILEEYRRFIAVYQKERSKQIEELHQVLQSIKAGSKEVVLSSELVTTFLYKQILGYKAKYDVLAEDDMMEQTLKEMETYILEREKKVWG